MSFGDDTLDPSNYAQQKDQDKVLILREWAVAVTDAIQAIAMLTTPPNSGGLATAVRKGNVQHHAANVEKAYERLREVLNDEVGAHPTIPE